MTAEFMERIATRLDAQAECLRDEAFSDAPEWFEHRVRSDVLRDVASAIREALDEEECG